MNNKKALLGILLAFVLLIGGATVLYNKLGQDVEADQMIVHTEPQASAEDENDSYAADETATNENETAQDPDVILAPDFTVYDKEGNEVRLSQYFGKPIVLNFWASWCGPCQHEMPAFNEKYSELGDEVHFVMVNMTDGGRETVETASAFIEAKGYDFPILFDKTYDAANTYGAYSLPMSFFINAQGHVIAQAVGAIDAVTLQKGIDMIME